MKNICYFFSIIFLFENSFSQVKLDSSQIYEKPYRLFVDAGLVIGNPIGDFRKNVPDLSVGLSFDAIYFPKSSIIGFGGHFDILRYGSVLEKRPWSSSIPDITLDVERSNDMYHLQFITRIKPITKPFIPYVDIFLGGTNMSTTTDVRSEHRVGNNDDNKIAETSNSNDWTFSYGAGIGFQFYLMNLSGMTQDFLTGEMIPTSTPLYFNFNYKYYSSGEAKYLRPEDVTVDTQTGKVSMDFQTSRTDISVFQVGVTLVF